MLKNIKRHCLEPSDSFRVARGSPLSASPRAQASCQVCGTCRSCPPLATTNSTSRCRDFAHSVPQPIGLSPTFSYGSFSYLSGICLICHLLKRSFLSLSDLEQHLPSLITQFPTLTPTPTPLCFSPWHSPVPVILYLPLVLVPTPTTM